MNDEKMFYIAPEVEVISFAPMETVATSTWSWNGTGNPGGNASGDIDNPIIPEDPDFEGEEE